MSVVAYAPGSTVPGLLAAEADGLDYYAGTKETVKYSDVNLVYRNNVVFNLSNVAGGSSSVYISPYAGALGTIMLGAHFPRDTVSGGSWSVGAALSRSYLWNAVDYVQFRYANGDTFQLTGLQMMVQAIKTTSDSYVANKMMQLAGQALYTPVNAAGTGPGVNPFLTEGENLWAYIPICLPHCQAQGENTGKGLRMDLLGAPVQLIVKMKAPGEVLSGAPSGSVVPAWQALNLQCKQIMPAEGQSLPRSMKPLPIIFQQQVNQVYVADGGVKTVQLVGFRSGSVKCLDIWVLPAGAGALDFSNFVLPSDVKLDFMGNRLYVADGYSSQFWNLTYTKNLTSWDNIELTRGASGTANAYTADDKVSSWLQIPFSAFHTELKADDAVSSSGIAIQNGQMSLTLTLPTGEDYIVYYSADIEAALDYEDNSVKYVF